MRDQTCFRVGGSLSRPFRRLRPVRFRGRPCPSADSARGLNSQRPRPRRSPGAGAPAVDRRGRGAGARAERRLQVDRIDPQMQDYSVSVARSGWTPALLLALTTRSQTNPPQDIFGGSQTAITNENLTSRSLAFSSSLPWGGATTRRTGTAAASPPTTCSAASTRS